MTATMRVRLILALAILFYSAIIAAGTGGFTPMVWGFATLLFIIWHLLMHEPSPAAHWPIILTLHGAIAAACLGLGHAIGAVTGAAVDPILGLSVAFGVTGLARMIDRSAGIDAARPGDAPHQDRGEER